MEQEVAERFERIERNLERASEGIYEITDRIDQITERIGQITEGFDRIREAHFELEGAQLNSQKAHERFAEETRELIANLTILVDRLIARDLGRN